MTDANEGLTILPQLMTIEGSPLLAQTIQDQAAAVTTLRAAFMRRVEAKEIRDLVDAIRFINTWSEAITEMAGLEK